MPRVRTLTPVVAAVVLLAMIQPTPASAERSRLEETRRQIRATRSLLRTAQRRDDVIRAALGRYTRLLNREQSALAGARANLARLTFRIGMTQRRLDALHRERAQRAAAIDARARALYMMGPVNGFEAIAGSRSLDEFVARAGALEFVGTFDRRALQDLARVSNRTRQAQLALAAERRRAAGIEADIEDRAEGVAEIVGAKSDAHAELADTIQAYRNEIAALQREQERIERIILQRSGGYVGTGKAGRLGFSWPTRGRRINSAYGPRWGGFHTGIDIDCRTGDPIAAAKDGRVIAAEWGGGYGRMVILDHGGGYSTLYAHQSRLYVSDGQVVQQHQLIGTCGSSGRASGDHLHFEVRVNGRHTNPRPYLP